MKIYIDTDELTLGDLEKLETGRVTDMLAVFDVHLEIEGIDRADVPKVVRSWKLSELKEIGDTIRTQIEAQANPEVAGKN